MTPTFFGSMIPRVCALSLLAACSSSRDPGAPMASAGSAGFGPGGAGTGASTGGTSAGQGGSSTVGGAGASGTGTAGSAGTVGNDGGGPTTSAELVSQLTLGWNLGNSLDAPEGETAWGNPEVSPALLKAVADNGFDLVRIPVTWSLHTGPGPEFTLDVAWMTRVEQVVQMAIDNDLYVIINLHHDGADNYEGVEWLTLTDASGAISAANDAAVEARFTKVWTQLSARFASFGHKLLFESMNEIHDGYDAPKPGYYEIVNRLNQRFVDIVRQSGGNNASRHLVVPGYNTNVDYTLAGFVAPQDPTPQRLILSVHYYDPWSFAGEATTNVWGMAAPGTDTWGQESFVTGQFDKLVTKFVSAGLPVIIGEYGAVQQTGFEQYRRYYMEYVTKAAKDRGILPVYWDNGSKLSGKEGFGLFDRTTNTVLYPTLLEAMQRAATSDYSLGDVAPP